MIQIFIGYIFIFLHVTVNNFDLLADFIGFFLVYLGMCKYPQIGHFIKAKPLCLLLAVVHFVISIAGRWIPGLFTLLINAAALLAGLYLIFLIIGGIKELELKRRIYLKTDRLMSVWRLMLVFTMGSAVLGLLNGEVFVVMAAMFGVAAMVTNVIFLFQLISVKEGLDQSVEE